MRCCPLIPSAQTFNLLELSDLNHSLTYDIIESTPAISVLSSVHTLVGRTVRGRGGGWMVPGVGWRQ